MTAQPWDRVRHPMPIPRPLSAAVLLNMDDPDFELLMRSHLVPRDQTSRGRKDWNVLWSLLRNEPILNTTAQFLQELLEYTQNALDAGTLDEIDTKRANKFAVNLDAGIHRLRSEPDDQQSPWRWSADLAALHPPHSRAVIHSYLTKIAHHRAMKLRKGTIPSAEDRELWDVLIEAGGVTQGAGPSE